ncbi:MAG: tRNA (uridine(54)-C5)-methyltransferase TrmA [Epsilonproteobacteria bacterium]|nr:tRNA (uridine(54)-C5)-methyltransferase TrmA [Campylobacterota bacterium]NPA65218.1 tRNA (uridine(54)-C5)-methyltransferase TrmA [Campylobacterota bacterium]
MKCDYFGVCGSCALALPYEEQLQKKVDEFEELFGHRAQVFASKPIHYRARAEYRIAQGSYAMHRLDGAGLVAIERCPMVIEPIYDLMPKLLEAIKAKELMHKLFRIDFLSGLSGEVLATLVYHRPIDEAWEERAKEIEEEFGIKVIGRSRGVKRVLSEDFITERLMIGAREYRYRHYEGSFTQPNPYVNVKMIEWTLERSENLGGDLLELYCGAGNFTLPLSKNFGKVLATEVSKSSIKAAKENRALNDISNVEFVRLSSEEVSEALQGRRFRRLEGIDMSSYDFSCVFVDPPRCGLDDATRDVIAKFENILYISCNPKTLHRDLQELTKTHTIEHLALFDQFPYTNHLEAGVFLRR